ncbi:hypothetical protein [Roseomonas fluvialis]|uniref:hypothetical protein n=1 Tax=Roseomonas fluvialis TaxID=1750527 RepID=UPI001FCB7984|nr:hypothetical protein [Roseomonas fluvialis]
MDRRVGRARRAHHAAIPGESVRAPGHLAAALEPAFTELSGHADGLALGFGRALRRRLRDNRGGDEQEGDQHLAHGRTLRRKDCRRVHGIALQRAPRRCFLFHHACATRSPGTPSAGTPPPRSHRRIMRASRASQSKPPREAWPDWVRVEHTGGLYACR